MINDELIFNVCVGNCDYEQERYFFSSKESKYRNGNRMNRKTNCGYWKATGSDKKISSSTSNDGIMGIRKTLVFYQGKSPNGSKTDWVLHEYRLVGVETSACNSTQVSSFQIKDVCIRFLISGGHSINIFFNSDFWLPQTLTVVQTLRWNDMLIGCSWKLYVQVTFSFK